MCVVCQFLVFDFQLGSIFWPGAGGGGGGIL